MMPREGHGAAPVPGILGRALSRVYGAAIGRINRRYDAGRGVIRFDRPVISVGNLSTGGTGKTPMVRHIVGLLLEAGHRPCIAMRGYKGEQRSDEAAAYARAFPDVPIVARADRTQGLMHLFAEEYDAGGPQRDCVVLDDGFQHRRIARDLDIVLVDATRSPFEDRLLPAGRLREPASSLRRAGFVVITHSERGAGELDRRIAEVRGGRGADATARHEWTGLDVLEQGVPAARPVSWLRGRRAVVVCAIGNPGPFLSAASEALGCAPAASVVLPDHDPFAARTILKVLEAARESGAGVIVTTDKDWSKLSAVPAAKWPCAVARPRLELAFERGGEALRGAVLATVQRGAPE